jgi:hypothetical protein
MQKAQQNQSD